MKFAVNVENLELNYGSRPVLREITFSVNPGEYFIIIGPNGSGKTSLIKAISGLQKADRGKIDVGGRPLESFSRKSLARKMAMVPQSAQVDFPFTVLETVLMGRAPHLGVLGFEGESDLDAARQAMAFTGIEALADRKMDQLSGGECQRVFIARAICQKPEIILLDEPTTALDLAHQAKLMDLMDTLKKERQMTVVMVSHDINLAALYADRMLLLKDGRIIRQGAPSEVLTFETLEQAYGCTLLVDESPLGRFPRITLVPEKFLPEG